MTDCFDCMEPENYAAVALKLQETALSAEACLFPVERLLRQAVNLPTLIRTSTATQSTTNNVQSTLAGTGSTALTFANSSYTSFGTVMPAGVWLVGCYINAIATGAVNDNTFRHLFIVTRRANAFFSEVDRYVFSETQFEANSGNGVDMIGCTTVVANGLDDILQFRFLHGNTSSTLNISIGAIYFAHRLSDQVALKTV